MRSTEALRQGGRTMTLNITLAARWLMAQSSDFRLTSSAGGPPLSDTVVSRVRPRGPRCYVTGLAAALIESQRRALEVLLASNPQPERLRRAVANESRAASRRASQGVSEACVAAHLLPDGSGEAQVFGNLAAPFIPSMIQKGSNVANFVPTAIQQSGLQGPVRLVGITWTANGAMMGTVAAFRPLANQTGSGWPESN